MRRHADEDTDYGTVVWDVQRLIAGGRGGRTARDLLHTVAAVDATDGRVVGFSELVVPGDGLGDAQHYGTAVLPAIAVTASPLDEGGFDPPGA